MSALPLTKPENISNLLTLDQEYPAPAIVAGNVLQKDWNAERERSFKDPEGFWADYARRFEGSQTWKKVLEWDGVHHQWFTGAKTNITINALDRHANSERCNRAAFIWLGEDGAERIVTYGQLYRMVCRFANGLKSLGVVKGDRVVIYMPESFAQLSSRTAATPPDSRGPTSGGRASSITTSWMSTPASCGSRSDLRPCISIPKSSGPIPTAPRLPTACIREKVPIPAK